MVPGNPFAGSGQWYRGNVHSHTTNSDGQLSVSELAACYDRNGYDFLFVTDHNVVTDVSKSRSHGILVMPGAEIRVDWEETFPAEVLALGIERVMNHKVAPQRVIDDVLAQGGLPFLSHPSLSGANATAISQLNGLVGIEIFNAPNYWTGRRGRSTAQWDELLANGHMLWGVASDDRHSGRKPELTFAPLGKQPFRDQYEAWVMVRAESCTAPAILNAMRRGQFYSTTGPRIKDIAVVDGEIRVEASPVRWIWFASVPYLGVRRVAAAGEKLTHARAPFFGLASPEGVLAMNKRFIQRGYLKKGKTVGHYVRVELWDGEDGYAWSNPIDLSRLDEGPR